MRWRRLRVAYRHANRASHHVLGFTVKAVLLAYFLFAVLLLVLRYAVLPNIDYYKGDIERAASRALGNRVTIDRLYASWRGLHPNLFLGDVTLRDAQQRQVLALPSVSATLSWTSLFALEPRFESLEVIRPTLAVRRAADGVLYVAGVRLDPAASGPAGGPDWLLRQREIVVREGQVQWTDERRGGAPLALTDLTLVLQNHWTTHRFALKATPPAELGRPLDLRARFTHPHFGARAGDITRWKGELYVDLRDTDLAAWKRYLDYPFALSQGRGSVRAWLALDQMRLAGFTADLGLAGVAARLAPDLPPLSLAQVSGRLSAREELGAHGGDGKPTFGALGHTISLERFSVVTDSGQPLPPATLTETWRPATRLRPEQVNLDARQVDLAALAELAAQLPLSPLQRAMLAEFAPRGQLLDFSAQWQGRYPAIQNYRVRGKLAHLSLKAQPARPAQAAANGLPALPARAALPGVDNLSGSIDATERGGNIVVDASDLALAVPGWLAEPVLPFDKLALQARWSYPQAGQLLLELDKLDFTQGALHGALSGRHLLPLGEGQGPGHADFTGSIDGLPINQVGRYLPGVTPPALRDWLTGALQGGTLRDARLRLRGDLAHFPFKASNAVERARGEFRVAGRIENGKLEYAPGEFAPDGKAPLWPLAEQINGSIVFDRARMEIRGDTLRTLGVNLSNVKAVIPDLDAHELMLDIDGAAAGPLQEFLRYVSASPVLEWIGNFTEDTRGSGNARLGLKLHMPLDHLHETRVQGALQLQNNDVVLFPELPPLQAALGRIEFNEHGFNLAGIGASFLGGPLALSGGTQRDGSVAVRWGGTLSGEGLRRSSAVPALQRLGAHVTGSTRYTGAVQIRDKVHTVTVDSSLAGVGLALPAPLNKAAGDSLPVHVVLTGGAANEAGLARDELRLTVGNVASARYLRDKQGRAGWTVRRGGIGVNVPAPEPDAGLALNVNLRALDLDHWLALADELAGAPAAASGGGDTANLAQYVVPDVVAARANELVIDERKLADVVVGATHLKGTWHANIHSRQATGYVTWNESANGQGVGKVSARLATLIIPESAANEVKDLLESDKGSTASIPALDIVAEHFELFNRQFGRLELVANNVQAQAGREWRIDRLLLSSPDGQLRANGRWLTREGRSNTAMDFALDIHDAGRLLDRLGFPETLRRGNGVISGALAWNGLPYALDLPSLSGQIAMNVEDGQFLKQDPGAAKLLGVLSLQALPRLLKLDFHDVFAEGLAFDGITANASINHGVLKTDNLKMHGVAATVLMNGTTDIANELANLHVVVIPEFNLGTGPLVYGLAVNPVIGLGSFLAQLFLRAPVMKALTYQMQISGPWKAPVITRLDNNAPPPVAAAASPRKE